MLEVTGLKKTFTSGIISRTVTRAVDDVSFFIEKGETLGLVGQSGCGKSTLGQCVLRLIEPTAGKIVFNGTDITALDNRALNSIRPSMQMIFQNPDSSLDPKMTIGQSIAEPLKLKGNNREKTESKVVELIKQVGLSPEHIHRFPHQLSGGQNQRAVIARVLALEPIFIVADEPTASLDISVQAQILNLLKDLKEEYDLTMLFISHDLELMKHMCERVAVMYRGKIVETGKIEDIFQHPLHPYTKLLLTGDSDFEISTVDYKGAKNQGTKNPVCSYYFECPLRSKACLTETPELKKASNNQLVACHHILKNVSGNIIRMENK
ncbi:oligopeptide/dipeptide ABC transporter ATP-binding protein [Methanosarcina vacuolata]|uniref:Oligopeptide transport ATP-binding protein OppF n=1 Tax=Methanosarcina vacuolata Z-761 TaxID=1434123 RepID=A0A0E3Q6N7_9EURY|nr:ABC transporter ATP-binding protein [Methanosarcina vacuolata]AKB44409.1 Oligopeptide transport ATP-binding protein OppF [Methanosarcina vacuolata Z-761]